MIRDKKNDTKPVSSFEIPPSFVDELDELSITNDLMDEDIYCFMQDLNLNTEYECEPSNYYIHSICDHNSKKI